MDTFFMTDNKVCVPYKLIMGRLAQYYEANGRRSVSDPSQADTIIVGCCGAFHSMAADGLKLLRQARRHPATLIAFGCLTAIAPEAVAATAPDRIVGSPNWRELADLVPDPAVPLTEVAFTNELRDPSEYRFYDPGRKFLLVQTGCSSDCPHCPHKLGIGAFKSIPLDELLSQMRTLARIGTHTVTVHGNDTGAYGTDGGDVLFPDLVERLLEFPVALHLSQVNADWFYTYRERLLGLLQHPGIKEFQSLIQSSSPRLLELMGRRPVVAELAETLGELRRLRPDLLLRTDLIIGYPTSTPEEDAASVAFAGTYFDEIAVHAFEMFPKTRLAGMHVARHPQAEVDRRAAEAVATLSALPGRVVHRGGQVYATMEACEPAKEHLRCAKRQTECTECDVASRDATTSGNDTV